MCEGPNEKAIIEMLLDAEQLIFTRNDLLGLVPYHARQLTLPAVVTNLNLYTGSIDVLRVGDTLNDVLKIPKEYREKINSVRKYCTKPELEMLFVIAEGLDKEFDKIKSSKKPKQFCKEKVKYHRKKYDNSTQFYWEYFGDDIDKLVSAIKIYKQTHGAHDKDEGYLADLLK